MCQVVIETLGITLISLTLWRFLTFHFFLPAFFLKFVLSLHFVFERFLFVLMTLCNLLDKFLLGVNVHLESFPQLFLVFQL